MFKKIMLMLLLVPACAFSYSEGKKLVNEFWKEVQAKHFKQVASWMTDDYQALSPSGDLTKKQDIQGLKRSPFKRYRITGVRTATSSDTLVVSYDLELIATSGNNLYHELFVYRKCEGHWKLCASSFIPVTHAH